MLRMLGPSDERIVTADRIAKAVLWVFTALAVVAAAGMLLFAADGAGVDVPMGFNRVFQRIRSIDHGLDLAIFK